MERYHEGPKPRYSACINLVNLPYVNSWHSFDKYGVYVPDARPELHLFHRKPNRDSTWSSLLCEYFFLTTGQHLLHRLHSFDAFNVGCHGLVFLSFIAQIDRRLRQASRIYITLSLSTNDNGQAGWWSAIGTVVLC